MLIAQDQLENVSRHGATLRSAGHRRRCRRASILLTNEAFERLLRADHPRIQPARGPAAVLLRAGSISAPRLRELLKQRHTWRGEVHLETTPAGDKAADGRADPVHPSPERVLGFVCCSPTLPNARLPKSARRRFQESIIEQSQVTDVRFEFEDRSRLPEPADLGVENAQLAALEITYGVDTGPDAGHAGERAQLRLHEARELLEHLIWHASRATDGEPYSDGGAADEFPQ